MNTMDLVPGASDTEAQTAAHKQPRTNCQRCEDALTVNEKVEIDSKSCKMTVVSLYTFSIQN